jgi:hypothetical protein
MKMKNATYQAAVEKSNARHVQYFVHMVTEGEKSYTAAWEVIVSRTQLSEVARAALWADCLAAAPSTFSM